MSRRYGPGYYRDPLCRNRYYCPRRPYYSYRRTPFFRPGIGIGFRRGFGPGFGLFF